MQYMKLHVILFTQKNENQKLTQGITPSPTPCHLPSLRPKNVSLLLFSMFVLALTKSGSPVYKLFS